MTIRTLPTAPESRQRHSIRSEISQRAFARWNPGIKAATDEGSISVFDPIGYDDWTGEGVTAKRIASALRAIGRGNPVTVNINSPGGDMFEGLAIYNLLREHEGEVTVKVLGMAASAASIIAMAGDRVEVARAGFLMIHNAWVLAVGNRNDLREMADYLEPFDRAMSDIYAARSGASLEDVQKLMDAETWIGGSDAIEKGFADALLPSDEIQEGERTSAAAVRRIESALRYSGMPKSEAMRLISEFKASVGDPAGGGEGDPTDGGVAAAEQCHAALLRHPLIAN